MGTPIFKLVFDRQKRAARDREGSVELRITYNRVQRFATTGVRLLPHQWKDGRIVKRLDAMELQHTLDVYVTHARQVINRLMEDGRLDMKTIVQEINGRQKREAAGNVPGQLPLIDYFTERATIRKYGRSADSQERYDRFLRWFRRWGVIQTFADLTPANILKMDATLVAKKMKPYSIWNNYHRFLNSFILDAIEDGIIHRNPYRQLHINKDKSSGGLGKYLTREELSRIEQLEPPSNFLRHARDLFVFQTYTCLSYTDLASFDASKIVEDKGRRIYTGNRGKTKQEFTFLLLQPAIDVLESYNGKLPLMSNVKYNECLKVIAVMCHINKPISSHWARHTGATLLLNAGISMEIVSKVLGHSSTKITREVYAKLLDETVADAMAKFEASL